MPTADGHFKGISIPSIPWHETCCEEDCPEEPGELGYCPLHD